VHYALGIVCYEIRILAYEYYLTINKMKGIISYLFIIMLIMFVSCGEKNSGYKVFILAGQSNMVGGGKSDDLSVSYLTIPDRFTYYRQCQTDQIRRMITFTDSINTFGPEVTFGHAIKKAFPNDSIIIVKCARGGASLYNAFYPGGSDKERALAVQAGLSYYDWFNKTIDLINMATKNKECSFEGVFWMQGERDCRFENPAAEYLENLKYLADSLRSFLNAPKMVFISGRVNPPDDGRYPLQDQVRNAQEALVKHSPPASWVNCDNLEKHSDDLHYNSNGQLELGRLFAEKYLEIYDR